MDNSVNQSRENIDGKGMQQWIHIKKWHLRLIGFALMFITPIIFNSEVQDKDKTWMAIVCLSIGLILILTLLFFMSRDKILNEKNHVKRFWLTF
jgi:hypothetical protein